jgi:hypothetical protein
MIPIVSGVDVLQLTILQKMSKLIVFPEVLENPAILYFIPSVPGKLLGVEGIIESSAIEGVFIRQLIPVGTVMSEPNSDADRLVAILVTGETMSETELRLSQAINNLKVIVQ